MRANLFLGIVLMLVMGGCVFSCEKEDKMDMTDECKLIVNFLNCDYEIIENEETGSRVNKRFNELLKEGATSGFYPLIIVPSDPLVEMLEFFTEENGIDNTPESIAAFRQTTIKAADDVDVSSWFSLKLVGYDGMLGEFESVQPRNELGCFMSGDGPEIIIAKIPVKNPWELAAWIPMGGFNDCPTVEEQIAVFQYWYEKYFAIPAVVTFDMWELKLTKPR